MTSKSDISGLGSSKCILQIENKLNKISIPKSAYAGFMINNLSQGQMSKMSLKCVSASRYINHPVVREQSLTSKVRVVFILP